MPIGFSELKKGMAIELNGEPYIVVDYERTKMQQRAPVSRIRLRELRTGKVMDRSFSGDDLGFEAAPVERRSAQFIYDQDDLYYFMDTDSFEQFPLSRDRISAALPYLKEQGTVDLVFFRDEPITVELPITVDLKVIRTTPGVRGDTAQGGTKPATLETGLVVQVPLFVNEGDTVRVDTRSGQYLSRV